MLQAAEARNNVTLATLILRLEEVCTTKSSRLWSSSWRTIQSVAATCCYCPETAVRCGIAPCTSKACKGAKL